MAVTEGQMIVAFVKEIDLDQEGSSGQQELGEQSKGVKQDTPLV